MYTDYGVLTMENSAQCRIEFYNKKILKRRVGEEEATRKIIVLVLDATNPHSKIKNKTPLT